MHAIRPKPRAGFTLLEISVVLAIIVVVAGLAIPIYRSTLKTERLRKAAETIRSDWTRTRTLAMRTGETQVWACTLADGQFSTSVYDGGLGATRGEIASMVAANSGLDVAANGALGESFGQSLPEGVSISQVLVSEANTVATMAQSSEADDGTSASLFFYQDGSCSSARLTVANEAGSSVTLMINGLSGVIRVTPVKHSETPR